MTISAIPLACPPRFGTPRNLDRPTLGPAVGQVARMLGKPFMPWQQYVADVVMEIDPRTGRFWYSEYDLTVPRQSGKSTFVLAKATHRCLSTRFFGPRQQLVYTAQTRKDARKKFEEDFAPDMESARRINAKPHWGNGNEHIRFPNRSRFGIESTTEKAGHGGTLDEAFVDEAFAQVDGRVEQSFGPAMITRANTQIGVISTAGWSDSSPYLWAKVEHGRRLVEEGRGSRIAYFEWSAAEDADPFDRSLWPTYMPALGHTISDESIAGELERAESSPEGVNGFKRPYMNLWVPKGVASVALDSARWLAGADRHSEVAGVPAFAVAMSPDNQTVSLQAVGRRSDGDWHVETVEHGPEGGTFGPDGLPFVERVAQVAKKQRARVWLHPGHPAGTLLADLQRLCRVETLNGTDYAQACGSFYVAVMSGQMRYRPPQPELDRAVSKASQRRAGETWRWAGDGITALVAATQALHGAQNIGTGQGRAVLLAQ